MYEGKSRLLGEYRGRTIEIIQDFDDGTYDIKDGESFRTVKYSEVTNVRDSSQESYDYSRFIDYERD